MIERKDTQKLKKKVEHPVIGLMAWKEWEAKATNCKGGGSDEQGRRKRKKQRQEDTEIGDRQREKLITYNGKGKTEST